MRLLLVRTILLSSLVFLISGCLVQKKAAPTVYQQTDVLAPWNHIAHLMDIPSPPGAEIVQVNHYERDDGIHYYLNILLKGSLDDSAIFYHDDMDMLGWQELMVSLLPHELVMVYLKPSKICMIHAQGSAMRIVVAPHARHIPHKIDL